MALDSSYRPKRSGIAKWLKTKECEDMLVFFAEIKAERVRQNIKVSHRNRVHTREKVTVQRGHHSFSGKRVAVRVNVGGPGGTVLEFGTRRVRPTKPLTRAFEEG